MHAPNSHRSSQPTSPRKGLTLKTIQALVQAAQPGLWAHERGLCLAVAKSGSAFWALRYSTAAGRRRPMTLQQYEPIDAAGLKALEWQVAELRKLIKAGRENETRTAQRPIRPLRRSVE
ncbi:MULTISPECIES: Arm DNA-binding domain-containing protein [unclassified Bradyrhizobium]|uniref:Arm DNA-binding domain-containing protein n=1 Tax=unclassified Bradyrhizobium TaxID=2631580 RepID=UPI00339B1550